MRGLKSNIDALYETICNYEPSLICIVVTHLIKEQIEITGYRIYTHDGTKNSKEIVVAIRPLKPYQRCEMLWILLNNQKRKIRIGVIDLRRIQKRIMN